MVCCCERVKYSIDSFSLFIINPFELENILHIVSISFFFFLSFSRKSVMIENMFLDWLLSLYCLLKNGEIIHGHIEMHQPNGASEQRIYVRLFKWRCISSNTH